MAFFSTFRSKSIARCLKSPSPWKDKGKEETETRRFASINRGMKSDFRWPARCIEPIESRTIYGLTHIIRCAAVFHTRVFARTNCWADFLEILYGWLLDDSKWAGMATWKKPTWKTPGFLKWFFGVFSKPIFGFFVFVGFFQKMCFEMKIRLLFLRIKWDLLNKTYKKHKNNKIQNAFWNICIVLLHYRKNIFVHFKFEFITFRNWQIVCCYDKK